MNVLSLGIFPQTTNVQSIVAANSALQRQKYCYSGINIINTILPRGTREAPSAGRSIEREELFVLTPPSSQPERDDSSAESPFENRDGR